MTARDQAAAKVCVGEIVAPHGVGGAVKVRCFTAEPKDILAYGPVTDELGRRGFGLSVAGTTKGGLICRLDGIGDREAAAALRGTRLYVDRDALPAPADADEFYHADLIGLRVENRDGVTLGRVRAVYDFGAGDVLDVAADAGGKSVILPFTRETVPEVDLAAGRLVAVPPPGLLDEHTTDEQALGGTGKDGR